MADLHHNPLHNATNVLDHGETVFTRTTSFTGNLKSDGPVRIYGVFDGDIETTGPVIIGQTARITGTVTAHDVGIAGTVNGSVDAYGRVEIYNGGRVYGDISSSSLRIDDGAVFTGQSTMREEDPDPFLLEPGLNGNS